MGTITENGTKGGDLGKALTEAMQEWVYEKKQEKIAQEALKLLELKFNFGKRLYRDKDELYKR